MSDLNTSHVKVQFTSNGFSPALIHYLNTSHVKVQSIKSEAIKRYNLFKYISC